MPTSMSDPIIVAMLRALWTAIGLGLLTTLTARQQGLPWEAAAIAGAVVALGALGVRGGVEGVVDQKRANDAPPASTLADRQLVTDVAAWLVEVAQEHGFDPNPALERLPGPLDFNAIPRPDVIGGAPPPQ